MNHTEKKPRNPHIRNSINAWTVKRWDSHWSTEPTTEEEVSTAPRNGPGIPSETGRLAVGPLTLDSQWLAGVVEVADLVPVGLDRLGGHGLVLLPHDGSQAALPANWWQKSKQDTEPLTRKQTEMPTRLLTPFFLFISTRRKLREFPGF